MRRVGNGNRIASYLNRLARQTRDALDEKLLLLKREAEDHNFPSLRWLKAITYFVNDEIVPTVKSRHHRSSGDHKGLGNEETHRKHNESRQKRKANKIPP